MSMMVAHAKAGESSVVSHTTDDMVSDMSQTVAPASTKSVLTRPAG